MEKEFWLERWEREEIGFHQNETNSYLRQFWCELNLEAGSGVFVPLCGKTLDMMWLRGEGHSVLGVELSPVAVEAFFRENGYLPEHDTSKKFERCAADDICILCGDFFNLEQEDLAQVKAVYDRASLVALPTEMRERYVRHLVSILPAGTQVLLITFDYPQAEMSGPPFAVSVEEVESLYSPHAQVRLLAQVDALAATPRFQERGLSRLHENIFLLTLGRKS
jgi:thiopurine S-methyltransferase